jgi:hypothetical protein
MLAHTEALQSADTERHRLELSRKRSSDELGARNGACKSGPRRK